MKFIHIADVHIGAHPDAGKRYSANREREILDTFKRVLEQCERERIELLLIAGGLFHRQPLLGELKEIDYMFSKLSVTKVVFVVGNSDYLRENTYYQSFHWSRNVYPILGEEMSCVQIPKLNLAVYGCSYYEREVKEKKLLTPIKLSAQKHHILLGYGGEDNVMPCEVEELEQLPYDYIALGCQHMPEILVKDRIAYAGALEPIRTVDYGQHGYITGEIRENAEEKSMVTDVKFVAFASREYIHKVVHVDQTMNQEGLKQDLLEIRQELGMQNMYQLELRGERNLDVVFELDDLDDVGNVMRIVDNTIPGYDLQELEEKNKDNLLGAYIKSFGEVKKDSIEYMALYMGVRAIEETKRG